MLDDNVPLSFEGGTNGAVVNNAGTISTLGSNSDASAIRIGTGPNAASNVLINNQLGGIIENNGGG